MRLLHKSANFRKAVIRPPTEENLPAMAAKSPQTTLGASLIILISFNKNTKLMAQGFCCRGKTSQEVRARTAPYFEKTTELNSEIHSGYFDCKRRQSINIHNHYITDFNSINSSWRAGHYDIACSQFKILR